MKKNILMVLVTIFALAGVFNAEAACGCKAEPKACPVKKTCPKRESKCPSCPKRESKCPKRCPRESKCPKCGEAEAQDDNVMQEEMVAGANDDIAFADDFGGKGEAVAPKKATLAERRAAERRAARAERKTARAERKTARKAAAKPAAKEAAQERKAGGFRSAK